MPPRRHLGSVQRVLSEWLPAIQIKRFSFCQLAHRRKQCAMTIRYLAILSACIAVALLWNRPFGTTSIDHTGRDLDIAIVGHGYFVVVDVGSSEYRYTRHGSFELDGNGELVTTINGRKWTIAPRFTIPRGSEQIAIHTDGNVQTFEPGLSCSVGRFQLARFTKTPSFSNPLDANLETDDTGPPIVGSPGNEFGLLQQGWRERRASTNVQFITYLLVGLLSSVVINATLVRSRTALSRGRKTEPLDALETSA
jgi:hypothetical protein